LVYEYDHLTGRQRGCSSLSLLVPCYGAMLSPKHH
jgi:hypothetical protein